MPQQGQLWPGAAQGMMAGMQSGPHVPGMQTMPGMPPMQGGMMQSGMMQGMPQVSPMMGPGHFPVTPMTQGGMAIPQPSPMMGYQSMGQEEVYPPGEPLSISCFWSTV